MLKQQWSVSVVVITSPLHGEGRRFEPGTDLFCLGSGYFGHITVKWINFKAPVSGWPSGLRRQTQGFPCSLIESFKEISGPRMRAWVQIPLLTKFFFTELYSS